MKKNPIPCTQCTRTFKNQQGLNLHVQRVHAAGGGANPTKIPAIKGGIKETGNNLVETLSKMRTSLILEREKAMERVQAIDHELEELREAAIGEPISQKTLTAGGPVGV